MKKLIAIAVVAVMMLMMCSFSAFAEFSPTAKPNNDQTTGSSTSPQTGDTAVLFSSFALLMAGAASVVAVKKIKG